MDDLRAGQVHLPITETLYICQVRCRGSGAVHPLRCTSPGRRGQMTRADLLPSLSSDILYKTWTFLSFPVSIGIVGTVVTELQIYGLHDE